MSAIITPSPAAWDAFVRQQPRAHILQLSTWGTLKAAFGWRADCIALTTADGSIVGGAQVLFRPLPVIGRTLAYVPMGPYTTPQADPAAVWNAIHQFARKHHAAFVKWEPGLFVDDTPPNPTQFGFRPSQQTAQPPRTILIDIRADDDTILTRMNQGTRRKIRQSQKSGIRYYAASRADVPRFNALMQGTGSRNAFGVHAPEYYAMAYDLFVPGGDAALILAEHEGNLLAAVMAFALGDTAWYFYGASSDVKRNLMASYGVQWEAIQWAKRRGCVYYDLWGIPDADEAELEAQFQERSDGLWGVYGFKRGWGGQVMRAAGAWDRVYNRLVYNGYKVALRLRGHAPGQ